MGKSTNQLPLHNHKPYRDSWVTARSINGRQSVQSLKHLLCIESRSGRDKIRETVVKKGMTSEPGEEQGLRTGRYLRRRQCMSALPGET